MGNSAHVMVIAVEETGSLHPLLPPLTTRYAAPLGLLLSLLSSAPALATTCTWLGGTSHWATPSAWSCGAVPGASDDVVIGSGTVTMDTGTRLAIRNLTLTGGTLTGPDSLTVGGTFLWEAGFMSGAGATLVRGATTLRTSQSKNIAREIILIGDTEWADGTLQFRDGGLLRNRGFFNDTAVGTHAIARAGSFTTEPLVHNQGRWQIVSAGTNTNVDFLNDGTLLLVTNGFKVNAPARFTHSPAARISGASSLDFTSGAVVAMGGFVEPGGREVVGLFEVRGPYPMGPQHVLDIEIGTGVPTADLLQTTNGTVSIAGVLWLRIPAGGPPSQPITVITHAGTGSLTGCYEATDVRVTYWDGTEAPYEAEIACTATTVSATFRAATAGEDGPEGASAGLAVTGANPFRGQTMLTLRLPSTGPATVEAFDALGRRVAVLFDGSVPAGHPLPVRFESAALPAGTYVVRASGDGFVLTQTLTLAR